MVAAAGRLLEHVWPGSQTELRETEEIFKLLGIDTIAGPYTGICVFCSDGANIAYAPGCHKDKDCCKCAIVNIDGTGWLVYPEHAAAVEFADGTGFMIEPKVPHCCTPSATNSHRKAFGLYCKEALAARGQLKEKIPAGTVVDWAMLERAELGL